MTFQIESLFAQELILQLYLTPVGRSKHSPPQWPGRWKKKAQNRLAGDTTREATAPEAQSIKYEA